jgi:hypothetical protein
LEVNRAMEDRICSTLVSLSAMTAESKAGFAEGVSWLTLSGVGEFISFSSV